MTLMPPLAYKQIGTQGGDIDSAGKKYNLTTPTEFSIFADTLQISPTIKTFAKDTLIVWYYGDVPSLDSASQVIALPQWSEGFIVDYAAYKFREPDLSISEGGSFLQQWTASLQNAARVHGRSPLTTATVGLAGLGVAQ
jgi:hypothetical protein